jgi:bis(5'-nucleosyl)-tetraphosphatase (symmetrical)
LSAEVSQVLQHDQQLHQFLGGMYGNSPALWHEHLRGTKRWRVITNYLTRMRLCDFAGELEFSHKEGLDDFLKVIIRGLICLILALKTPAFCLVIGLL